MAGWQCFSKAGEKAPLHLSFRAKAPRHGKSLVRTGAGGTSGSELAPPYSSASRSTSAPCAETAVASEKTLRDGPPPSG